MLRAVGREFDNKYPAPEKLEKQRKQLKLSPDSGFDEEENKEEYDEPLSPDSELQIFQNFLVAEIAELTCQFS